MRRYDELDFVQSFIVQFVGTDLLCCSISMNIFSPMSVDQWREILRCAKRICCERLTHQERVLSPTA